MEKGNIKIVEIADFKNSEHVLDYVDNDFVIINSLEGSPYNEDTIRLGCFLIAICLEGCIQLEVNYKTYQLEAGDLLLGLPNTIISHAMVSPKHKIRLAAFSRSFCSAPRWGSRSVMQNTGSFSSSPTAKDTLERSARVNTPWMASGMVPHWYLRMPP